MRSIPYGRQSITEEDIEAVVAALKDDYLTQGPRIEQFEQSFAAYTGAKYAIAVSNGTAALHLCAMALEVGPGDTVITTPITFAASANCIEYCGGTVAFADIDPKTYLLDIHAVRELLESAPAGTYKGIVPVNFAGRPVDLQALRTLADQHGLWIIEDACHSPGGYFTDDEQNRQSCGNGTLADCTVFSFHPVKHIATGEGGMITTNDRTLYEKLRTLRTHGITRDNNLLQVPASEVGGPDDATYPLWYMEMQQLGYNYRITDIQAALGSSQLRRAEEGLERRKEIAAAYHTAFHNKSFVLGQSGVTEGHAYHLYVLEVKNRLGLYNHLREKGIFAQIHYIPCHLMPYYRQKGWSKGQFPHAEKYYDHCISLPMFPSLTDEEQQYVIQTVCSFYG
jgi:UDP-4-amino-4,6-dideoxy-N-acetyl-beta-L-altrosamine transaminase